ncbi:MAG TPA: hypothetical protein VNQ48_05375 [Microbacteriaceae bacterium]|nr:hypothetical protein [Microbacteriaceae bacterium]
MKVVGFIICFLIFVASLYLMSLAFSFGDSWVALVTFAGGLLGVCVAFALPIHLAKRIAP